MYFYKNCVFATFFHRPSTTNQGLKTLSDFAVNQYQLATDDCSGVNNWKKIPIYCSNTALRRDTVSLNPTLCCRLQFEEGIVSHPRTVVLENSTQRFGYFFNYGCFAKWNNRSNPSGTDSHGPASLEPSLHRTVFPAKQELTWS